VNHEDIFPAVVHPLAGYHAISEHEVHFCEGEGRLGEITFSSGKCLLSSNRHVAPGLSEDPRGLEGVSGNQVASIPGWQTRKEKICLADDEPCLYR
jgi:hypothetical protein